MNFANLDIKSFAFNTDFAQICDFTHQVQNWLMKSWSIRLSNHVMAVLGSCSWAFVAGWETRFIWALGNKREGSFLLYIQEEEISWAGENMLGTKGGVGGGEDGKQHNAQSVSLLLTSLQQILKAVRLWGLPL